MTYSLHTLSSTAQQAPAAPARTGLGRFANELALITGLVLLTFWLISLLSYSVSDAAWSTSGGGEPLHNRAGRLGAWLSDISYFCFGFSVWWCFAAGVRSWLTLLANWMRSGEGGAPAPSAPVGWFSRVWGGNLALGLGLVLLMSASCTLEWSRLYSLESHLPDHAGGALGYWVGPWSVKWLGFAGSGLVAIALIVVGMAMVFRFSWSHVAESIGAWLYSLVETRREKREIAEDLALGQHAAREREEVVVGEREEIEVHHPLPVVIEPVIVELPPSARVAKERQKPLFS